MAEKIESNPIRQAKPLKVDNVRECVLTQDEFELLLDCRPDYIKPVVTMAFYQPMRLDEVIRLEWSEVDLEDGPGFIFLDAHRTKIGEARHIPLHSSVRARLRNLPSRSLGGRVFLRDGQPFENFRKSFNSALRAAGIEDFVFHDFRHCAITNLRKAGNDYSTIMKASGHKTMAMFHRYNLVGKEDVAAMRFQPDEPSQKPTDLLDQLRPKAMISKS